MASAYKAAAEFDRAYLRALKAAVKGKRAESGHRTLPEHERVIARSSARSKAQEEISAQGGPIVKDDTKGRYAKAGYIIAQDKAMSGWGHAPKRSFYVVQVDTMEEAETVMANMGFRSEMKKVHHTKMLPNVRSGDHMHIVDKEKAWRFFKPPHEGGFAS